MLRLANEKCVHGTGHAGKPFVSTLFLLGVIEVENDEEDVEVRALWEQSIPSPNDQLSQAAVALTSSQWPSFA